MWIISVPEDEDRSIRIDLNCNNDVVLDLVAKTLVNFPLGLSPTVSEERSGIEADCVVQAEISYERSNIFNIEKHIEECWEFAGLRPDSDSPNALGYQRKAGSYYRSGAVRSNVP